MKTINELSGTVDRLSERVHELAETVRTGNTELRRRTNTLRLVLLAVVIVLAVAISAATTVLLDNRAQLEENNRKFCPLIEPFVPKPGEPPSPTPRGKRIAQSFAQIAVDFHCKPEG